MFPEQFNFLPKTYLLRTDYDEFLKDKKKYKYWIIKPVDSARGKGIRVVSSDEKIRYDKGQFRSCFPNFSGILVSQYIANPHLIKGYKYDIRFYVLVTCVDPLKVKINFILSVA